MHLSSHILLCFFFNDTATTEIYTLSLHDALPIWAGLVRAVLLRIALDNALLIERALVSDDGQGRLGDEHAVVEHRSEEHTSELQSQSNLVCRLLLEKKNTICGTLHVVDI